jgi:hypothetical protein
MVTLTQNWVFETKKYLRGEVVSLSKEMEDYLVNLKIATLLPEKVKKVKDENL